MGYRQTNRLGTVIVFKKGMSLKDATKALKALETVVDHVPQVRKFNDEYGGPVWYIP